MPALINSEPKSRDLVLEFNRRLAYSEYRKVALLMISEPNSGVFSMEAYTGKYGMLLKSLSATATKFRAKFGSFSMEL